MTVGGEIHPDTGSITVFPGFARSRPEEALPGRPIPVYHASSINGEMFWNNSDGGRKVH